MSTNTSVPPAAAPPRFSVIIPTHCNEKTIGRAVASVLAQDWSDFELIVVNDGSTDGTGDAVRAFSDRRLRLVEQPKLGEAWARNRGVAEARGRHLAFLDGDDEWFPHALGHAAELLDGNPDVRACVSGHVQIDRPGQAPRDNLAAFRARGLALGTFRAGPDTPPEQLVTHLAFACPWTTVVERELVVSLGGFFARARQTYGADAWLFLAVLLNAAVRFDGRPVAIYHHEDSTVTNFARAHRIEPFLADVAGMEGLCPAALHPLLHDFLALRAMQTARHFSLYGKGRSARTLLRRFGVMKRHPLGGLLCHALSWLAPVSPGLRPLFYGLKRLRGDYVPTPYRGE